MEQMTYSPIGIIHSPHKEPEKTPIQPVYAQGITGKIEVYPEYVEGLKDLEGFSHIYLIYHFHKSDKVKLTVKPFLEYVERGLFSTRAPFRPNPIGLSIVKLLKIEDNFIEVENIDILDGTPLLDIKPYTSKFDSFEVLKSGWQDNVREDVAQVKGRREYQQ